MLMQPLWGNSNIKYFKNSTKQHECLIFKAWIDSGITHVADIEIKHGQILEEFLYTNISNHSNIYAEIVKISKALKDICSLLQSNTLNDSYIFIEDETYIAFKIKKKTIFIHTNYSGDKWKL